MTVSKKKKQVRKEFRDSVFQRDNGECRTCKRDGKDTPATVAHHIIDSSQVPDGGYTLANGISLCNDCHWKSERHWMRLLTDPMFHPEELAKLVGFQPVTVRPRGRLGMMLFVRTTATPLNPYGR